MGDTFKYKAFISYSHADEKWARWLHRALESYRPPKHLIGTETPMGIVPPKLAPVFRDREELASSTDLGSDLTAALEGSATQIVICSPASANSHWVNEEILAFKRLGRSNRIFSLIVDGEPYSGAKPETAHLECFPLALRYQLDDDGELSDVPAEPIAADARPGKDGKNHAKVKLLAGVLGVGFDALRQRELQRRNRRLAIVTGASVVGMVVAVGLATTAVIARNEADRQRVRAQQEAETARQTAEFMIGLFEVSEPSESRGKSITAREILVKGAERIETELQGQPAIQASLMNTMGQVFTGLGLYADASGFLSQALDRRRQMGGDTTLELNETLNGLANVKVLLADYDEAEALYKEAIKRLEAQDVVDTQAVIDNLAGLAELYFQTGQYEQAEPILRQVLAEREALLGREDLTVAEALEELGLNMFDQGRYEDAEQMLQEALTRRQDILGGEPHPDISENMSNLGLVLRVLGRYDDTEELFNRALAMDRRLYGDQHPAIATDLNNLAELNLDKNDLKQAEARYKEALAMQEALLGKEHPDVARIWNNLAYVYYYSGNLVTARDAMLRSIDISRMTHGEEHPEIAGSLSTLGRWLTEAGDYAEAEHLLRQALAQQVNLLDADHESTALTRMALADVLIANAQPAEALELAVAAKASLSRTLGEDHWFTSIAVSVEGAARGAAGDDDSAEILLESGYQRLRDDEGAVPVAVDKARKRLADFYESRGEFAKLAALDEATAPATEP